MKMETAMNAWTAHGSGLPMSEVLGKDPSIRAIWFVRILDRALPGNVIELSKITP